MRKILMMLMILMIPCSLVSAVELVMPRGRCDGLLQSDIELLQAKLAIASYMIETEEDKDPFCDTQIDLDLDGEDDYPVFIKDQQNNYYMLIILQVNYSQWVACYRGIK